MALIAAVGCLMLPAVASATPAGLRQVATKICFQTPTDRISLTQPVSAGDDLVVAISGGGYASASPIVTSVSDTVNGAWSSLVNDAALTTDNTHYLSYAVYHFVNSAPAPNGLTVTVTEKPGQSSASAVLLDVPAPVSEGDMSFTQTPQHSSSLISSPTVNGPGGQLAVGLFGAYNNQQTFSAVSPWTLDGIAPNCTAALAESQLLGSSAAVDAQANVSGSTIYLAGLMTFNEGTAATAGKTPPKNTAVPVVSGTAQQGSTLRTSNGSWSANPTSYAYQWQRCTSSSSCSDIGGATSSSYTLVAADVGDTVRSVVTAANASGSASADSAQTATVAAPPSAPPAPVNSAVPVVSGVAREGSVLSTSNGSWSGSPTSYGYQWQRCVSSSSCSSISGATSASYTLVAADVGDTVRSVVTASNAGGSGSATSAQTQTVVAAGSGPVNTGLPVVSGTAVQGDVLSTSNGSWSGSPSSYSYQWQRCSSGCSNITGATSSSYTLAAGDVGDTVRSVVTASNGSGSASASSAQTQTVAASGGGGGGGGSGSGSGLHVSARNEPCPNSTATTCSDLLDANGNVVHMHGVDLSGSEYACIQGWGIFSGAQNTQADINSMLAWHINFVRIQLNEDCWLGVNTSGISSSYVDTSPGVGSYATAIENFVSLLHQNGIYTEIVDMWNAPGTDQAVGQSGSSGSFQGGAYYGPDEDHSPAMWASMAQAFANDPMTILSPAGEENVSMACQMNGCANEGKAPNNVDGLGSCGSGCYYYNVAGLSQALSVMRSNGFKGPIALGCAHFEGTCDQGSGNSWLNDKPTDSLSPSQIMAEVHNYGSGDCAAGASCFNSQFLPVLQGGYPLFEGELGEGTGSSCSDTFLPQATSWADAYGVGYMNWTWTVGTGDCYGLLTNYSNPGSVPTAATFTATTTQGSTQITASSTNNLTLGQTITGTGLPAGDTITNISGNTLTMSLQSTNTGTPTLTALQANAGWIQAHDESYTNAAPMTNISRGQPAYCVGSCSNSPSVATDNNYGSSYASGHYFDCTYPCGLAIDLSGVPASQRHNAVVAWYNGSVFDPGASNGVYYYNVPSNYTIDVNTAPGGSLPSTGWTTVQTVTNNPVTSRVANVNLGGANWVRIYATSGNPNNASGNLDFDFKLDVLSDNSSAPPDTWLFLGDSVTDNSMSHQDVNSSGSCCFQTDFMQSLNATESAYYPAQINGGIGSWPSDYELRTNSLTNEDYFQDALNYSGAHYLAIDYGGTNSVSGDCGSFYSDEMNMITRAFAAGYQPVSRYSPTWSQEFPTQAQQIAASLGQYIHGPALGSGHAPCPAVSTYLYQIYPQLLVGPDYYNFFQSNQNLNYAAGSGNPHPTHPQGENAYRQLYVQAALFNAHGG